MVEKETLIDKVSKHPKIWAVITLAAALSCIVLGALGLLPIKTVSAEDQPGARGSFVKAEGSVVRCDSESFEIRNTFCRYLPTGVQYIYLTYTEDDQPIFVRAPKDWADSFDENDTVNIYGAAMGFNESEKAFVGDSYAVDAVGFVDLIYVRLNVMLIIAGVLLLADAALGALMIKEKISPQSKGYGFANVIFCTLPVIFAALVIHIAGFI